MVDEDLIRRIKSILAEDDEKSIKMADTIVSSNKGTRGADLRKSDLRKADLSSFNLNHADLRDAELQDANLRNADLRYADLSGADLTGANLVRAKLNNSTMKNALLIGADLKFAIIWHADLENAKLNNANMNPVELFMANLTKANLEYANLSGSGLKGAHLEGANLHNANVVGVTFENATFDNYTDFRVEQYDQVTVDNLPKNAMEARLSSDLKKELENKFRGNIFVISRNLIQVLWNRQRFFEHTAAPIYFHLPAFLNFSRSFHRRVDEGPVLGEIVVDVHQISQELLVDRLGVEVAE